MAFVIPEDLTRNVSTIAYVVDVVIVGVVPSHVTTIVLVDPV
jgi:hypothetical protein